MSDPPSLEEIQTTLAEEKPRLAEEYGVAELGVFGSIARGEGTGTSDVDILVTFEKPIGLIRFVGLEQEIEDILGLNVDLNTKKSLKPWMRDRVEDEVVPA